MYVVNIHATIDEQKQADFIDYLHKKSLLANMIINRTTSAKINLERVIWEMSKSVD